MQYKSNTFIITKNRPELMYILEWSKGKGKNIPAYMWDINVFPYCLNIDEESLQWIDRLDRAVNYKSFNEFLCEVSV